MTTQNEIVFEIGGEGGGITISRQKNESGVKYIYHHNEFDPTGEGLDVNINDEYDTFHQAFQLINNKYPWYMLYIETVHEDFRNYITKKLVEKLNKKSVSPDYLEDNKNHLEEVFQIKLNHIGSQQSTNLIWSYVNI